MSSWVLPTLPAWELLNSSATELPALPLHHLMSEPGWCLLHSPLGAWGLGLAQETDCETGRKTEMNPPWRNWGSGIGLSLRALGQDEGPFLRPDTWQPLCPPQVKPRPPAVLAAGPLGTAFSLCSALYLSVLLFRVWGPPQSFLTATPACTQAAFLSQGCRRHPWGARSPGPVLGELGPQAQCFGVSDLGAKSSACCPRVAPTEPPSNKPLVGALDC